MLQWPGLSSCVHTALRKLNSIPFLGLCQLMRALPCQVLPTNWCVISPDGHTIDPALPGSGWVTWTPFLCTRLVFAFASMRYDQIVSKLLQDERILYPEFNKLTDRCVRTGHGGHIVRFYRGRRITPSLLLLVNFPPILRVLASSEAGCGAPLTWELPDGKHAELGLVPLPCGCHCLCLECPSCSSCLAAPNSPSQPSVKI